MTKVSFKRALASLAAASIAVLGMAAPAQAAATAITLAPLNGTSTGAIVGSQFFLKAGVANASSTNVTFLIEGVDESKVSADIVREDSVTGFQASDVSVTPILLTDGTGAWGVDGSPTNFVNADGDLAVSAAPTLTVDTFTSNGETAAAATPYFILALDVDATEFVDGGDVTVTAFEDGNLNGIYDADLGEIKSSSVVISFMPVDEVTVSATQTLVSGVSSTVTLNVTYGNVNMGSIAAGAGLTLLGDAAVLLDGVIDTNAELGDSQLDIAAGDFDDTDDRFEVTSAALTGDIGNGSSVVSRVYVGDETGTDYSATVRTGLNAGIASFDAANIEFADTQNYVIDSGATAQIRDGSGSFVAFVDALDADGDAVGAGEEVTFTIAEGAVDALADSDAAVTAGGKTLANDSATVAEDIEIVVETDADGRASLTISYSDLTNADDLDISAAVVGSIASSTTAVTVTDASAYVITVNNVDANGSIVKTLGSSQSVSLSIRDQYGLAPANDHRVAYAVTGSEMNSSVTGTVTFPGGTGNGTISWTDSSDDAGTITLAITGANLEAKNALGNWVAPTVDPRDVSQAIEIVDALTAVADVTIDTAASSDDTDDRSIFGFVTPTVDLQETNSNFDTSWKAAFGDAGATDTAGVVDVDVTDVDNVGIEGAAVTFSAAGVYFSDESETLFSLGSITVYTDANGNAVVGFESNVVGDHTITVTSGGKSDSVDVVVDASTDDGDVEEWVVTAPATVAPQSTYTLSATIQDEFGNYVDGSGHAVSITYSGPGIQIPTASTITTTSAKGVVGFNLFFGAADAGTYTVTLTHGGENGVIGTGSDDVSKAVTFTIGTVGNVGAFSAWTSNQDDGTVKMYAKNVIGAGKVQFMVNGEEIAWVRATSTADSKLRLAGAEGAAYLVRTVELVEGQKNALEIYVDGVRVERNAYSY